MIKGTRASSPEALTPGSTETFSNSKSFQYSAELCPKVFHHNIFTSLTKHKPSTAMANLSRSLNLSLDRLPTQPCPPSNQLLMGDLTTIFTSMCRSASPSSTYHIIWATKLLTLTICIKCRSNSGPRVSKYSPSYLLEASTYRLSINSSSKFLIKWSLTKLSRSNQISPGLPSPRHKLHSSRRDNTSSTRIRSSIITCRHHTENTRHM